MLLASIEDKIAACFMDEEEQYTDFLSLEEADAALRSVSETGLYYSFEGGYPQADRRILCLGAQEIKGNAPISVLCGKWDKFGEISHRDILGSIMATGIERRCLGDILVLQDQRKFYLFVVDRMVLYITSGVDRIGRCSVTWSVVNDPDEIPAGQFKEMRLPVSSLRIDVVIAAVWHLSRQTAQDSIADKRVFINHKSVTKSTQLLRPGDSVVVRGCGKFVFLDEDGLSKKGKTYILIKQYQ